MTLWQDVRYLVVICGVPLLLGIAIGWSLPR